MSNKLNLYATGYWVPFPSSEYGGLVVIAASDEEEAKEIALDSTSDTDRSAYSDEKFRWYLSKELRVIGETDRYDTPRIVEEFTT